MDDITKIRKELMHNASEYNIRGLRVAYMGEGWAIYLSGACYNKFTKEFDYEPSPSNRDNDYFDACRFDLTEVQKAVDEILDTKCVVCGIHKYLETGSFSTPYMTVNFDNEGKCPDCHNSRIKGVVLK